MADQAKRPDGALGAPILIVLALCGGFGPFAIDAYLPGLPAIAQDFGVPASQAQLTLTGFLLALGLSQLVLGPLSDQTGRRRVLLVGLAGAAVASALCAVAPSIWVLIVARILQGAFGGAGLVLSRAIVADLAEGIGVARAFSMLMSVQSLAPVIAPIMGGLLVPTLGWRSVFWFLALLGIGMLVAAWVIIPESLPAHERITGGVGKAVSDMVFLLRFRSYAAAVAMFIVSFGILFSYVSASPFVLQRIVGLSEEQFSIVFTMNSLAILGSNLTNARLVARMRPLAIATRATPAMAAVVVWLTLAVLVFDVAGWAVIIGFFCLTVCVGFLFPNLSAVALEASGSRRGAGSALMGASQMILAAAVAPLTGIGNGQSAVPMVLLMLVFITCQVVALLVLRTAPENRAA